MDIPEDRALGLAGRFPAELRSGRPAQPGRRRPRASDHLSVRDRRQDQVVPAPDDDLPFVLNVETAFRITGQAGPVNAFPASSSPNSGADTRHRTIEP